MSGTLRLHHAVPRQREATGHTCSVYSIDGWTGDLVRTTIRREYRILRRIGVPASSARAAVAILMTAGQATGRPA
jgi:hypothetical protein